MKKAVYFFCPDPSLDEVASGVLAALKDTLPLSESGLVVDGMPAYTFTDAAGNRFDFVSCAYYFSHRYETYLPMANKNFADYDVAGYINWHGGANAPDKVLTVHTIGNVTTGHFAPSDPVLLRNLAVAIERGRVDAGLDDFSTHTEATHWSGAIHGSDPALIEAFPVPIFDIEIGSEPETLKNRAAAGVLANACCASLTRMTGPRSFCAWAASILTTPTQKPCFSRSCPISIGHFLPSQSGLWAAITRGSAALIFCPTRLKRCAAGWTPSSTTTT